MDDQEYKIKMEILKTQFKESKLELDLERVLANKDKKEQTKIWFNTNL